VGSGAKPPQKLTSLPQKCSEFCLPDNTIIRFLNDRNIKLKPLKLKHIYSITLQTTVQYLVRMQKLVSCELELNLSMSNLQIWL